jgi:ABC-type multidrug transport system ATPase subunit
MDYILEVIDLHKSFKEFLKKKEVLKGVNLKIKKGEIYGFLGPNGA